jgi:hypothetical protein
MSSLDGCGQQDDSETSNRQPGRPLGLSVSDVHCSCHLDAAYLDAAYLDAAMRPLSGSQDMGIWLILASRGERAVVGAGTIMNRE